MKSYLLFFVAALCVCASTASAQAPDAKEPAELDKARRGYLESRAAALEHVDSRYQLELEKLQRELTQADDLDGALFVRAELKALRENAARDGRTELAKALTAHTWAWTDLPAKRAVELTFREDGSVSHVGMEGIWQVTGPREVTIQQNGGPEVVLRFDALLTRYQMVDGQVCGRPWR